MSNNAPQRIRDIAAVHADSGVVYRMVGRNDMAQYAELTALRLTELADELEAAGVDLHIDTVQIRAGDTVVVKVDHPLSQAAAETIKRTVRHGVGVPLSGVLVTTRGTELAVLHPEAEEVPSA